ncbi:MAG: DUF6702 family protein [Saprospiraceae bacterium]|nr:DUF6702 family protein [Saprospiraceae bacterium]
MIPLLVALIGLLPVADHAFYVSVVEVRHIGDVPSATVTVKVFSDDLQTALRNRFGSADPAVENLCLTEHARIMTYFAEHLHVSVNDSTLVLRNTSCGFEGDAHQLQFAVTCPGRWEYLEISADFFMEVYPTQTQMVHVNEHGDNYTLRLTRSKPVKSLEFRQ